MKYTIQKIDESVPGVAVTKNAQGESKKGNDKYYSDVQKKMKDYEKPLNPKEDNIEEPKYEFTDEAEEYHRLGEIMNGLEMFRYDNEPSEQFKERARMGIEGDSKMGNAQTDEPVWGASDKDFGKKLVKSIEKSVKKRNDAVTTFTQFGDDIELVPGKESKLKNKKVAIGEDVIPQNRKKGLREYDDDTTDYSTEKSNILVRHPGSEYDDQYDYSDDDVDVTTYDSLELKDDITIVSNDAKMCIKDNVLGPVTKTVPIGKIIIPNNSNYNITIHEDGSGVVYVSGVDMYESDIAKIKKYHKIPHTGTVYIEAPIDSKEVNKILTAKESFAYADTDEWMSDSVIPKKPIVRQQENPKPGEQRKYIQNPDEKPVHPPKIRQQDNPVSESEVNPRNTHFIVEKSSGKIFFAYDYTDEDPEYVKDALKEYAPSDIKDMFDRKPSEFKIVSKAGLQKQGIDPMNSSNWVDNSQQESKMENNNEQVTESKMKRAKFKTPFNGIETALNVIPEGYKVDKNIFEMTDGNENYKIRWEGDVTKGRAIVLEAYDKSLIKEDMDKIFHLMGYNPSAKHGTIKGKQRIEENAKFFDLMKKVVTESTPKEEVLTESEEKRSTAK